MDFSDIRTIIIGEAGEYGKRLVRYLEIHLSSAVRVYHFTTAEGMVSFKEEAEIYLLDERFFKELSEEKQKFLKQKKLILLTWREEQGSFCKYDNPQKLLDMLSDFTDYNSDLSDLAAELKDTPTKLTIVYSPVYDEYLEQIARSFMSLGDVYMGAEDLGYKGIDSEYGEGGDMGDLCYYIHLREENILDILQDMLIPKEEVQVLHSPDLYFYLRELTKEDYAWFFDKIKKESPYREVFWGAGNCFVANILCYGDIRWLLLEQILLFPCFNVLKRKKREKEKHLYEKGFQNLLQSMMTSLQAGYSLNNSCRIALKELEELYQDQNNPMLRQMRRIIQGLDLHITLEQLFMEFAESTGLEEAKQFAVVIEIVRSTGGNMVEILKRTMQHLKYKMDTEEEIRVLLSGKLFEKNIMLSMPFFILLYLRLANPEYVECFYNTILGHLVMSGMIGITVFCFFWSEKIMNIRF